jgi:hypothetical protein
METCGWTLYADGSLELHRDAHLTPAEAWALVRQIVTIRGGGLMAPAEAPAPGEDEERDP